MSHLYPRNPCAGNHLNQKMHRPQVKVLVSQSCPDSLQPQGLQPTRFLCPWNSPDKNSGVGCCSVTKSCLTLQHHGLQHARLPCPSPSPRSLLKLMCIELMMPSDHLILCLLWPSIFPSIRIFSNESALCSRWPKYQSFSFSINPFNEYSEFISLWLAIPFSRGPSQPRAPTQVTFIAPERVLNWTKYGHSQDDWPETNWKANLVTIKPKTPSSLAEQFFWVPPPCCSLHWHTSPIRSFALSICVSPDNSQALGGAPLPVNRWSIIRGMYSKRKAKPMSADCGTMVGH